jgi:sulfate permease, SulP family
MQRFLPQSVILAIISFMLTYSVSKKYASANHYDVDSSQELIALGAANAVGSFFGSFPVAGGFARTAVNVRSMSW